MSNPRLDDRLAVDGPGQADRFRPPASVGPELLQRDLDHPVLAEVLRYLMECRVQAGDPQVAYYEDSP